MNEIINESQWPSFLREYSALNQGRATRLGVFETRAGVANDYWIEDGLPLIALDVYPNNGKTRVDIMLETYTHPIESAAGLVHVTDDGADRGLDIMDAHGMTTILRFENWPIKSEDN